MKKPKSKSKPPQKSPLRRWEQKKLAELHKILGEVRKQEFPTVFQLAQLAVNFADKDKVTKDDRVSFADSAIDLALMLWFRSFDKLQGEIRGNHIIPLNTPKVFYEADTDEAGNISRETFLQKVLPQYKKHRSYDAAKIGKAFIYNWIIETLKEIERTATEAELQQFYEKWNAGDPRSANAMAQGFNSWYQHEYITDMRRAAGLKSAKIKKLKKSL